MLHQIEVCRCFGAEAADILWLLGGIQSTRSPVIGHGTESTSSVMAWGGFPEDPGGCSRGPGGVLSGVVPEIWSAKMLSMTNKTYLP